ncbi:hypothetical protein ACFSYD_19170 [Paracoccus aerius]
MIDNVKTEDGHYEDYSKDEDGKRTETFSSCPHSKRLLLTCPQLSLVHNESPWVVRYPDVRGLDAASSLAIQALRLGFGGGLHLIMPRSRKFVSPVL